MKRKLDVVMYDTRLEYSVEQKVIVLPFTAGKKRVYNHFVTCFLHEAAFIWSFLVPATELTVVKFMLLQDRIPMTSIAAALEKKGVSAFRFDFPGNG